LIFFIQYRGQKTWEWLISNALSNLDFILLPFVLVPKTTFFNPYGLYEGYNVLQITLPIILELPSKILNCLKYSFFLEISDSFIYMTNNFAAKISFFWLMIGCVGCLLLLKSHEYNTRLKYPWSFLVLGIFSICLAVLPYLLVGHDPITKKWADRDQLLIPLGASFLLVSFIWLFKNKLFSQISIILCCVILSSFCISNNRTYYRFHVDWLKQLAIVENFRYDKIIKNHTSFIFYDKTQGTLNASGRVYHFY
jgi:hypothetical protein